MDRLEVVVKVDVEQLYCSLTELGADSFEQFLLQFEQYHADWDFSRAIVNVAREIEAAAKKAKVVL